MLKFALREQTVSAWKRKSRECKVPVTLQQKHLITGNLLGRVQSESRRDLKFHDAVGALRHYNTEKQLDHLHLRRNADFPLCVRFYEETVKHFCRWSLYRFKNKSGKIQTENISRMCFQYENVFSKLPRRTNCIEGTLRENEEMFASNLPINPIVIILMQF